MHVDELADDLHYMYAEHIFQRYNKPPETLYDALLHHAGGDGDYLPAVREVQTTLKYDGKMYLLAGDERMCDWAQETRTCYRQGPEGGFAQTAPTVLGAFDRIMRGLAERFDAAFVLVDAGPSSDEVNKIMATSCDYIQPTVMLDFYNWTSVRGLLLKVIPSWFSWQKKTVHALGKMAGPKGRVETCTMNKTPPYVLPFLASLITGL